MTATPEQAETINSLAALFAQGLAEDIDRIGLALSDGGRATFRCEAKFEPNGVQPIVSLSFELDTPDTSPQPVALYLTANGLAMAQSHLLQAPPTQAPPAGGYGGLPPLPPLTVP